MSKIIVLGSSNTDMIVKVPRIPEAGETILGGTFIRAAGGKGANQAVAAARSGGDVTFIANTGDDSLGREAIEGFKKDGINTSLVLTDENAPSGVALIFVADDGENSIAVASGANATLTPDKIKEIGSVISEGDILLMQLETPIKTIEEAAKIGKANGAKIILNPAPAQALGDELLKKIDVITPNETEAELLTGIKVIDAESAGQAASKLLSRGLKTVIITLGAKGSFVMSADSSVILPAYRVDAIDTTAAGDTFNGVLAVGLAENKEMEESIQFANAAAALSVTRMGAQTSIPKKEEIIKFLSKTAKR